MKRTPEDTTMWKRLEDIFVVLALLFCAGAFLPLLSPAKEIPDEKPQNATIAAIQKQEFSQSGDPTQANRVVLVGQILVYGVVTLLFLRHRRQIILQMRHTKLLWAVVALAFMSVLWSDVPGFALRRCMNMAATSAFGLYLGYRYSPRQLLRLLGWALTVSIVFSILVVLLRPDLGIDSALTNHAWKGIFVQKNTLGRLMALGVLVFLFLAIDNKTHRRAYTAASLISVGMLVMARSDTSAILVPILLLLLGIFALARQRPFWPVFASALFMAAGITCGLMLFSDTGDFFAAIGRDSTLSGRVEIWSAVLPKIMDHPLLGSGYSSFWLGLENQSSADLWSMLHWHVPHSHNGFLDLVLELGVVGLGLFLANFIMSLRRGLLWARLERTTIGLWPLVFLSFMFLFNLTEGSILRQDNLLWVLYVATSVFVVVETDLLLPELSQAGVRRVEVLEGPRYAPVGAGGETMEVQS
jgi:exopolysaccharide production protein ExoQ